MSKMTLKIASFTVVAMMLLAGVLLFVPTSVNARSLDDDQNRNIIYDPIGMTVAQSELKGNEDAYLDLSEGLGSSTGVSAVMASDPILTNKTYIALNLYYTDYYGSPYYNLIPVMKMGEGEHCEVWVGKNLFYPTGDPRNAFTSRFNISTDQVNYIIDEFDNNIYSKMTNFIGEADSRNGSQATLWDEFGAGWDHFNNTDGGKIVLMIYNIRDLGYYDNTYPYYTAGFYYSTADDLYDRNIIHIDCFDWANRTGPQTGNPSGRPFLYEGVVTHEYQHLLHDLIDPNEENFINEGVADYSEILCGYGVKSISSHITNFLIEPSNSLTVWGDGDDLADYGAAALFQLYLNDKFGGNATIAALVKNNKTGTASVTDTLKAMGYTDWNFDKVFKNWRLANLLDSNQPGNGVYKYNSLNLADFGSMSMTNYNLYSGVFERSSIGEYGTDYIETYRGLMRTRERLSTVVNMNGDNVDAANGWQNFGWAWWSGASDVTDYSLQGTIDLTGPGTTHSIGIMTDWSIELGWDFGFLQVSTDGVNWTSLENYYTTNVTDPNAMPSIVAELPGITGFQSYSYVTWDLTEYDDMVIDVRFRYMTDWGTTEEGWYIYDIYLDGSWIDDPYYENVFSPVLEDNNWFVTLVLYHNDLPMGIIDIPLNYADGWTDYMKSYKPFKLRAVNHIVAIVSPTAGFVDYDYGISNGMPV